MFGLFRRGPLLDTELAQWQFDCFEWLFQHTGGIEVFKQRRLILPTPQFFPHNGSRGHAFAEMILSDCRVWAPSSSRKRDNPRRTSLAKMAKNRTKTGGDS
jgi:hypothetical protein